MNAEASLAPPDSLDSEGLGAGMVELRVETIELAVYGVLGLAFCVLVFGAFGLNHVGPGLFAVVAGLAAVGLIARAVFQKQPGLAATVVVGGLIVVATGALIFLPGVVLAPWFALAVLLAGALLGWQWGTVSALAAAAILATKQFVAGLSAGAVKG